MQAWKGRESTGSLGNSRPLSSKPGKSGTSGLASEPSGRTPAHRSSRLLPTQMRPPWRGAGLLQLRWRTWNPIPQDVLHRAHEDHGVHAPFLVGSEGTGTGDPLSPSSSDLSVSGRWILFCCQTVIREMAAPNQAGSGELAYSFLCSFIPQTC